MMKTNKQFDCVEMKHKGAQIVQGQIAGMTIEQELAYWAEARRELDALRDRSVARRRSAEAESAAGSR